MDEPDAESGGDQSLSERDDTTTTPPSVDLSCSQHLCSKLLPPPIQHKSKRVTSTCLGHLDATAGDTFRLSFFPCCSGVCRPSLCYTTLGQDQCELMRMDEMISRPRASDLSIIHQLQLALRIATAVLKFNATPWLSDFWTLKDLAFFSRNADLPSSLQTLHFSIESAAIGSAMDVDGHRPVSDELEEARLLHGIQNATLYSLGVALLSIGWWNHLDPYDVLQVRRLAGTLCPLGPRYHEVTKKVLECDFGYGKDIEKPKLQEAIYSDVLLELESMISILSLDEEL